MKYKLKVANKDISDFLEALEKEEAMTQKEVDQAIEGRPSPPSRLEPVYQATSKNGNTPPKETGKLNPEAWDKVALSTEVKYELQAAIHQYTHRDKIFNQWGLGKFIERGRGVGILLYGPPGTGKTQTANCIAEFLGTTLLKADVAEIESMIPGRAEQNVKGFFSKAKQNGYVLFIDECDALINSRNSSNMMEWKIGIINCLLTEIENHDGVVILATNRLDSLDPALNRRLAAKVEIPYPNESTRIEIWKLHIPDSLPVHKGVSFPALGKRFLLSGGEIKNAVLTAARMASMEGANSVKLTHFVTACQQQISSREAFKNTK